MIAGILHLAQLGWLLASLIDFRRTAAGRWLPVLVTLVAWVAVETVLWISVQRLLTVLTRRASPRTLGVGDALHAAVLAAAVALPFASRLKLMATGAHLRTTDLWFVVANWRQLLAESTPREQVTLLGAPVLWAVLWVGLWLAFRLSRRGGATLTERRLALAAVAAGAALTAAWSTLPAARRFVLEFVPEAHWAGRQADRPGISRAPAADRVDDSRRAIGTWQPAAPTDPANVVLVMLESVSWPRVLERPTAAPRLAALAGESTLFERPYAVATHSDYAQMAVLSSLHPRKYPRHDFYADLEYPRTLLWDPLRAVGYSTALFSCQNESWGNMIRFLDTPGLEVLRHAPDWPRARRRGRGAESKVFAETPVGELMRWLTAADRAPFFAYLNFQATHFPYEVPEGAARPFRPDHLPEDASFIEYPAASVPDMRRRYDNSLHYVDRWVGEVIDGLRRLALWESTIFIVVADHGEAFYEHGLPTHGTGLHEEQVRALWILRIPGEKPRIVTEPVSLLDVAPTVLAALGLPPHGNFQGRGDVLSANYRGDSRPQLFTIQGLVSQDAVLDGDWKLIVDHDRRTNRLFHLATDPGERIDRMADSPERARELDNLLRRLLGQQLGYYAERDWRLGLYPPPLP